MSLEAIVMVIVLVGFAGSTSLPGDKETPFFCNLKALTPAQRTEHQALTVRLADVVVKTRELPDGYAFELDGNRFSTTDLATWTEFERKCCPFFDFNLEWRRENGPMTLRLTGRDGVKSFIQAEFPKNFR